MIQRPQKPYIFFITPFYKSLQIVYKTLLVISLTEYCNCHPDLTRQLVCISLIFYLSLELINTSLQYRVILTSIETGNQDILFERLEKLLTQNGLRQGEGINLKLFAFLWTTSYEKVAKKPRTYLWDTEILNTYRYQNVHLRMTQ